MKKVTCLLLLSFVLMVADVKADMVADDIVEMDVQITNLDDFPDMAIVAFDSGAMPSNKKYSLVKDKSLPMSHSLGKRAIYYIVKKDYLGKEGIDKIKWETDRNVQRLNVETGLKWDLADDSDVYSLIQVDLKLAKKKSTYYVYKTKVTGKQQAGADVVKIYKDDVVDPLEPIYISEKIL